MMYSVCHSQLSSAKKWLANVRGRRRVRLRICVSACVSGRGVISHYQLLKLWFVLLTDRWTQHTELGWCDVREGSGGARGENYIKNKKKTQYQRSSKDPLRAIITLVENVLNNLLCKKCSIYLFNNKEHFVKKSVLQSTCLSVCAHLYFH